MDEQNKQVQSDNIVNPEGIPQAPPHPKSPIDLGYEYTCKICGKRYKVIKKEDCLVFHPYEACCHYNDVEIKVSQLNGKVADAIEAIKKEQPKQGKHPNLNAGNSVPDNNFAEKWKTPEERIIACEQYCEYLRQGRSKAYYPEADENTIKRYMEKYPKEFRTEKIEDAERRGLSALEGRVIAASVGKIPGANATLLIWLTKNKLNWRDKQDITSDNQRIDTPKLYTPVEDANK